MRWKHDPKTGSVDNNHRQRKQGDSEEQGAQPSGEDRERVETRQPGLHLVSGRQLAEVLARHC